MDGSPPGSSVHGMFQARMLEWFLLQEMVPTQGSSLSLRQLLHQQADSLARCGLPATWGWWLASSTSAAAGESAPGDPRAACAFVLSQADSSLLTGISTPSVTLSLLELSLFLLFSLPRRSSALSSYPPRSHIFSRKSGLHVPRASASRGPFLAATFCPQRFHWLSLPLLEQLV